MLPLQFEIVCLQDAHREKFDLLGRRAIGWGLERIHFASTEALAILRVTKFGANRVVVVLGEHADLSTEKKVRAEQCADYSVILGRLGVDPEQIITLNGDESPEDIEGIVRERVASLLDL